MKFSKLYTKVIEKESYNDMDVLLTNYETFEEIPLISQYHRAKYLRKKLGNEGTSKLLINLADFILNIAQMLMRANNKSFFYAITFTDFECYREENFIIPNIFIYPDGHILGFPEKIRNRVTKPSTELQTIQKLFIACGISSRFEFHESRFHDVACNEEIVRIYAMPK